jgi:hypothetical protein
MRVDILNVEVISTKVKHITLVVGLHIVLLGESLQKSLSLAEEPLEYRRFVPEGLLMKRLLGQATAVLSH